MSKFKNIDNKLNTLAIKLNASLSKVRPGYPEGLMTFEERRIDWRDGEIRKAIIIQPTFEATGVNSSIWNFINIAWTEKNGLAVKPGWIKTLIDKSDFKEIEENIDNLLFTSEENLKNIRIEDLI
jgi:hypothetical protein